MENCTCSAISPTTSQFQFISFAIILIQELHATSNHVIWCSAWSDPAHRCLKVGFTPRSILIRQKGPRLLYNKTQLPCCCCFTLWSQKFDCSKRGPAYSGNIWATLKLNLSCCCMGYPLEPSLTAANVGPHTLGTFGLH